ncbi:MAG TPA: DUF2127 domain-containing protein [Candidatus Saccharimonadales bacterium]|nr:DUF2127 domain-containing protein [Candidatus Saccharimonadales bacterium]
MAEINYNPAEHPRDLTDRAFRVSLYIKGAHGLLETIGGIFLFLVHPEQIDRWAESLTRGELSQDPHDFIATHILRSAHEITGASLTFAGLYLLSHGIVKLVLVVEVIRDHLWAYIGLITVTALFAIYQIYRIVLIRFSVALFLLTIIDLVIIYLTQKEYRRQRVRQTTHETS